MSQVLLVNDQINAIMENPDVIPDILDWYIDRTPDTPDINAILNDRNLYNTSHNLFPDMDQEYVTDDDNDQEYDTDDDNSIILNVVNYMQDITETPDIIVRHMVDVFVEPFEVPTDEEFICCVCMEDTENDDFCALNCNHTFCVSCVGHIHNNGYGQNTCPLCREPIASIATQNNTNKTKLETRRR